MHKRKNLKTVIKTAVLLLLGTSLLYAFTSGAPPRYTGGFEDNTCAMCHNSYDLDSGRDLDGTFDIIGVPDQYTPGEVYPITVTIAQPAQKKWGFQLAVRAQDTGEQAGIIEITDSRNTVVDVSQGVQFINQTRAGAQEGVVDGPVSWTFNWRAPDTVMGDVVFHAAGNAADGDGSYAGDYIYTDSKVAMAP
ncbi:MAG: hypothetical protein HYR55_17650 [Acidobacteria bacterium]|nr:hypothetical protein [Acidobacteriota bacterium]MBI3658540.1 hypothetical protein [Acidobacteriota bacterium]